MAAPKNYSVHNLEDFIGHDFGVSDPILVDQEKINAFADVTGDHQWIHIDTERAKSEGPFGCTIAHGFLTLSLLATASATAGALPKDASLVINYGLGKVRFLAPVPSGSTVRAQFKLTDVQDKPQRGKLVTIEATLTTDGADQPAVIAEKLALVMI